MSLIFELYSIYRRICDCVIVFIFWLYNKDKKKVVRHTTDEILLQSATSLARQIKSGKLKSSTVVETFIRRIKEVNPLVNALVDERFQEALAEANRIDDKLRSGSYSEEELEKLVFLGVPFTCKESTLCKGLSATFGLVCRKGLKAEEDADVVSIMKGSGAILLGVCNVPEINLWMETYNVVFGRTNNPYDTTRNVGGSTGGDGSLIASLGIPFALGTDIAGSVRAPSFRCGIFGHKPTNDLISTRGMIYRDGTEGATLATPGVMAKRGEDLLSMLRLVTKSNPKLRLDEEVDITKVRILYTTSIECFSNGPIGRECKESVRKCVGYFDGYSEIKPKSVHVEGLNRGTEFWLYSRTAEKGEYRRDIKGRKGEAVFSKELFKYLRGRGEHPFYSILLLYKLQNASFARSVRTECSISKLKEELMQKLGDDGILIMPAETHPVGYHYAGILPPLKFGFYPVFNVLKFPATQVPIGLNSEGLPLGVQIVAAPFNDRLTIAVANELERAFGGYVQPIPNK